MKKWLSLILLVFVFAGLVACGSGEKASTGNSSETAEDIFTKAINATEEMESAELEIEMKQEMEMDGELVLMESKMEGSMVLDPVAMYQKGTISMKMEDEKMDMEQELYLVDNEIYMFESMTNQWIKMDDSMIPLEQLTGNQMDTKEQLKMLEDYIDELVLDESDDVYVISFSPDGEKVKELADELLQGVLTEEITAELGTELTDVLGNTEIKNLNMEMKINKDSFQIEAYDMDMEISMSIEGEELNQKVNTKTIYKNINTVESIEVPEEVKESAVELPGM